MELSSTSMTHLLCFHGNHIQRERERHVYLVMMCSLAIIWSNYILKFPELCKEVTSGNLPFTSFSHHTSGFFHKIFVLLGTISGPCRERSQIGGDLHRGRSQMRGENCPLRSKMPPTAKLETNFCVLIIK